MVDEKLEELILNSDSLEVVAESYLAFRYAELFLTSALMVLVFGAFIYVFGKMVKIWK